MKVMKLPSKLLLIVCQARMLTKTELLIFPTRSGFTRSGFRKKQLCKKRHLKKEPISLSQSDSCKRVKTLLRREDEEEAKINQGFSF